MKKLQRYDADPSDPDTGNTLVNEVILYEVANDNGYWCKSDEVAELEARFAELLNICKAMTDIIYGNFINHLPAEGITNDIIAMAKAKRTEIRKP